MEDFQPNKKTRDISVFQLKKNTSLEHVQISLATQDFKYMYTVSFLETSAQCHSATSPQFIAIITNCYIQMNDYNNLPPCCQKSLSLYTSQIIAQTQCAYQQKINQQQNEYNQLMNQYNLLLNQLKEYKEQTNKLSE